MAEIQNHINEIKTAIYGRKVRGSLADGLEAVNKETVETTTLSKSTQKQQEILEKKYNEQIANATDITEIKDFHVSGVTGEVFQTMGKRADAMDVKLSQNMNKVGISYEEFGAALDGETDDTESIRAAHEFANQYGLPVIQRNSIFVLNGEIEVKTDVDLSGSTLITTIQDPAPIEFNRTSYLYSITGEPSVEITDQLDQTEFVKGAVSIPSLSQFNNGSIVIKTLDVDLMRNDSGNMQQVNKSESNAISEDEGTLAYPLTKDYSTSTGFRVLYKPFQEQLTFKMPKVVLKGAKLYSIIKSDRNNVELTNGLIVEKEASPTISPLYTIAEFIESHNVKISNVFCPAIGRNYLSGQNGLGYLFLFTRSSKIHVDRVSQLYGWSGINGNWFRDMIITNSNVLSISGHANAYDLTMRDCTIYKSITIHGGGILDVDNCVFLGKNSPVAITTRTDYASEFEGLIRVRNCTSIHSLYLVQIHTVDYNCGRKVYLPDVEISNCHMKNPDHQGTYLFTWRGFTGDYDATLPNIKINDYSTGVKDARHKTLYLPEKISNQALSGAINIEVNGAKIPNTTFDSNLFDSNLANIQLPHIANNNVEINLKIRNSLANFSLFGTSNINIKCDDCDIYAIRTGTKDATSVTQNGDLLNIEINNSVIHRGFCDFQAYGAANRINLSIVSSKYLKYFDRNGETDGTVGSFLVDLIKYARNNKAEPTSILPSTGSGKLFNYTNDSYWKQSTDTGVYKMNLSNVMDNAQMEYYKFDGVNAISIGYTKINSSIAAYGKLRIATLPEGYRPKTRISLPLTADNGKFTALLEILSTGEVNLYSRQGEEIPGGSSFYAYGTYI
ncbi:hypothetical protein [Cytobacillus horneckiae]|uniref:Pectate lyase superfamily protein domain-containing protein n=1 Tax=Cytobacillus horneckiae TaxID=549687 RepID=A0A2N0ZMX6_9BACI|nr:hypothetical protein [Cytobacillus horneckiae]PKG30847.1 hypothetical protein CWS20_01120 [Cytobacillus horneckiae]